MAAMFGVRQAMFHGLHAAYLPAAGASPSPRGEAHSRSGPVAARAAAPWLALLRAVWETADRHIARTASSWWASLRPSRTRRWQLAWCICRMRTGGCGASWDSRHVISCQSSALTWPRLQGPCRQPTACPSSGGVSVAAAAPPPLAPAPAPAAATRLAAVAVAVPAAAAEQTAWRNSLAAALLVLVPLSLSLPAAGRVTVAWPAPRGRDVARATKATRC